VWVVLERQQRRHIVVRHQPDAPSVAPVTPVGAALGYVRLTPERNRASTTITGLNVDLALVNEHDRPPLRWC
jgi:hypothetical protein